MLLKVNQSIDDFSTDINAEGAGGPSSRVNTRRVHKRKIVEVDHEPNRKPGPIVKLLTVVRKMEQMRRVRTHAVAETEAQAQAQAQAQLSSNRNGGPGSSPGSSKDKGSVSSTG